MVMTVTMQEITAALPPLLLHQELAAAAEADQPWAADPFEGCLEASCSTALPWASPPPVQAGHEKDSSGQWQAEGKLRYVMLQAGSGAQ